MKYKATKYRNDEQATKKYWESRKTSVAGISEG